MTTTRLVIICATTILLAGCTEEPPPRSVGEFLENRILLEATMVRCGENRNESKYDAECVNAREAINRIAAEEEKARRQSLEAQFERKRRLLRRTQEAAAEARRRADEARRRREEAEYLGVFEDEPPGTDTEGALPPESNVGSNSTQLTIEPNDAEQAPANEAGQAGQDLEAIREELRRRQEDSN
jgi:hypothetical protein